MNIYVNAEHKAAGWTSSSLCRYYTARRAHSNHLVTELFALHAERNRLLDSRRLLNAPIQEATLAALDQILNHEIHNPLLSSGGPSSPNPLSALLPGALASGG